MIGLDWDLCSSKKSLGSARDGWKKSFANRTPYRNEQTITTSDGDGIRCLVRSFPLIEKDELICFYGFVELIEDEAEV